MKMNMKTWALAAGLGFAALSAQAQGVDYQEIGTSGDWTAITFDTEEKGKVCAIYSRPVDSQLLEGGEPRAGLRGERAAFITWENGKVDENDGVFSAMVGAPLADPLAEHTFATEHGEFPMFGYEDRLFADETTDSDAIDAIRRGLVLTLKAVLPGERVAKDEYSLKGVVAATRMAIAECGGV